MMINPDELLTTAQAAELAGVTPQAVRVWHHRGHLEPAGRNDRGHNLWRLVDVARAEHHTREHARRVVA